jgi:hypothetical protein
MRCLGQVNILNLIESNKVYLIYENLTYSSYPYPIIVPKDLIKNPIEILVNPINTKEHKAWAKHYTSYRKDIVTKKELLKYYNENIDPIVIKLDELLTSLDIYKHDGVAALATALGSVLEDANPENEISVLLAELIKDLCSEVIKDQRKS